MTRLPLGHKSRKCVRCVKVGPRCIVAGGWSHFYCLTKEEKVKRTSVGPTTSKGATGRKRNMQFSGDHVHDLIDASNLLALALLEKDKAGRCK